MSWSLKKWVFGSGGWTKPNIDFQQPQGVYFLEKYGELSEPVAFGQKLRYFTDQNGPKVGRNENEFCVFSNSKINVTADKQKKNMVSFVQFPCFLPDLSSLDCLKKCIFCNFVLTSARNLSLSNQFTYMHLKDLGTLFRKMALFIML